MSVCHVRRHRVRRRYSHQDVKWRTAVQWLVGRVFSGAHQLSRKGCAGRAGASTSNDLPFAEASVGQNPGTLHWGAYTASEGGCTRCLGERECISAAFPVRPSLQDGEAAGSPPGWTGEIRLRVAMGLASLRLALWWRALADDAPQRSSWQRLSSRTLSNSQGPYGVLTLPFTRPRDEDAEASQLPSGCPQ